MTYRLFVYGTLAPGRPNEHVLAAIPGSWEAATVKGKLFQEGWGARAGFPGIAFVRAAIGHPTLRICGVNWH